MGRFFQWALSVYEQADVTIQMKSRVVFSLCLILIAIMPILLLYTYNAQVSHPGVGMITRRSILLTEVFLIFAAMGALVLLIRGYFSLASHLIIICVLATIGLVMIFDKSHVVSRLDTIIFSVAILAMTPLIITRYKSVILVYGASVLIFFYGYVFYFLEEMVLPQQAVVDYLGDTSLAVIFVTMVAYYVFSINDSALKRARAEIDERQAAEKTVLAQKEELEQTNRELSRALEQMELTTREYEQANLELMRAQSEILKGNRLLQESEEKFSKAFYLSPQMVCLITLPDRLFVEVSDSFCKIAGYRREQILGRTSMELNIWGDPFEEETDSELLRECAVFKEQEIAIHSTNGTTRSILLSSELIELRQTMHAILVGSDITERKQSEEEKALLEAQLHQAQKMETLGRLAGGMAHDFNNLLTAIIGNADLIMMENPAEECTRKQLTDIIKAAASATDLIRQLLAFSRKQIIEPRAIDLSRLIHDIPRLIARLIGEDIRLEIVTDPVPCIIKADPGQIEQIIINLAVNARDAMPYGGRLTLETAHIILDNTYSESHLDTKPGPCVLLTVTDCGHGMSPEVQSNIFDPFFTTKPQGKGTGLGLATVYGAVKQNGGSIEVYSEVGCGTSFKIYFPLLDETQESRTVKTGNDEIPTGTETVLVAEDSVFVLMFAKTTLEKLGYTVLAAGNGEDALELADQYHHPIDLLITDVIMPGMNGRVLADRLMAARPGLRVLFASGYTENAIVDRGVVKAGIHFIGKPYSVQALAHKIREALAGD